MKKLIFVVAGALLAAVVAVVALSSASLQTAAVSGLLKKEMEGAELKKIRLGLGSVNVSGLKIPLNGGGELYVDSAQIKFSAIALLSKEIDIESAVIDGARLDLTAAKPDGGIPKDPATSNAGVAKKNEPPQKEASKASAANGTTLPDKSANLAKADKKDANILEQLKKWSLRIGSFKANLAVGLANKKNFQLGLDCGNIKVGRNITANSGRALLECESEIFKNGKLSAQADISKPSDRVELRLSAKYGAKQLFAAKGLLESDMSAGEFEASSDFKSSDIEELANLLETFPAFNSKLYAKATFADFAKKCDFRVAMQNSVPQYKLLPKAKNIGVNADISASKDGNIFRLGKLDLYVSESGTNILSAQASRTFEFCADNFTGEVSEGEVARVRIGNLNPGLLDGLSEGMEFSGEPLSGEFSVGLGKGNSLSIRTLKAFNAVNFSARENGKALVEKLNASVDADAKIGPNSKISCRLDADIFGNSAGKINLKTDADIENGKGIFRAKLDGELKPLLEKFGERGLSALSGMRVFAETETAYANNRLKIEKFAVSIKDTKNLEILNVLLEQPLEAGLSPFKCEPAAGKIFTVKSSEIPFSILKPFVSGVDAESIKANISISAKGQGAPFEAQGDAAAKRICVENKGEKLFRDIDIFGKFSCLLDLKSAALETKISEAVISDSGTPIATLSGSINTAGAALKNADINASVSLPRLLAQPALRGKVNILAGLAEIKASAGGNSVQTRTKISSLKIGSLEATLDTVELGADILLARDINEADFSKLDIDATLKTRSSNGASDLRAKIGIGENINAQIDAPVLSAEDISAFAGLASGESDLQGDIIDQARENAKEEILTGRRKIVRPKAPSEKKLDTAQNKQDSIARRDAKAVWDFGRNLTASAKLGKFLSSGRTVFEKFSATLEVSPSALNLKNASMFLYGASVSADLCAKFDSKNPAPYSVRNAKISAKGIDISQIFADPSDAPFTGIFDVSAVADSQGNNISHLAQFATFKASLGSRGGGSIRIIDEDSAAGATASAASTALKLAGGIFGGKVKELGGLGELVGMFTLIEYSSISAAMSRTQDNYDFSIDKALVMTPKFMLRTTNGKIFFDPNLHFTDMRMDIPVEILVSDKSLASLFKKINYCTVESDVNGYYKGPKFSVTGTASKPENNLLQVLVGSESNLKIPLIDIFK